MMDGRRHRPAEESAEGCSVPNCGEAVFRSLSRIEARKGLPLIPEGGRRAPVCRTHYREYKKATKEARTLSRLDW